MDRHYFETPCEPGRSVKVVEVSGDLGKEAEAHTVRHTAQRAARITRADPSANGPSRFTPLDEES